MVSFWVSCFRTRPEANFPTPIQTIILDYTIDITETLLDRLDHHGAAGNDDMTTWISFHYRNHLHPSRRATSPRLDSRLIHCRSISQLYRIISHLGIPLRQVPFQRMLFAACIGKGPASQLSDCVLLYETAKLHQSPLDLQKLIRCAKAYECTALEQYLKSKSTY